MKASILDMRRNPKKILDALARCETVTLTNRGKQVGRIEPIRDDDRPDIMEHEAFGMWADRSDMADPSAYVRELERRFKLDAGQMSTAESIHEELLDRADSYVQMHAAALKTIPVRERGTHEAYEPVRKLFVELKSRLDAIPTTSQRYRAGQ